MELIHDEQTTSLSYLVDILENELLIYENILENLKSKQESIVTGNVTMLRSHVSKEKKYVDESQKSIKKRTRFLEEYYSFNNMGSADIDLATIIEHCDSEYSHMLINLKFQLRKTLSEIGKINNENKMLLNFCIEHVKGMAHLFLKERQDETDVYATNGILYQKSIQKSRIDRHI